MNNTSVDSKEQARLVHKSFFDRTKLAIDNGFYLEAICMEYNALESRLNVILGVLGMPCGYNKEGRPFLDFGARFNCLIEIMKNNDKIFQNSYLKAVSHLKRIGEWTEDRNIRIHALYLNTEKTEKIVKKTPTIANRGFVYAREMYNEADRLKRLKKRHPEYFENINYVCPLKTDACVKTEEFNKRSLSNQV